MAVCTSSVIQRCAHGALTSLEFMTQTELEVAVFFQPCEATDWWMGTTAE
jgi:hypothetical protein